MAYNGNTRNIGIYKQCDIWVYLKMVTSGWKEKIGWEGFLIWNYGYTIGISWDISSTWFDTWVCLWMDEHGALKKPKWPLNNRENDDEAMDLGLPGFSTHSRIRIPQGMRNTLRFDHETHLVWCCSNVKGSNPQAPSWLVVWTPLKNISQLGWLFPIYGNIKNGNQTTNQ